MLTFCASVDINGYLPVHNRRFSQPQRPGDPVWNAANARLESCSINLAPVALPMYSKSGKIEAKLAAAGINFAWLTLDEAKEIAS